MAFVSDFSLRKPTKVGNYGFNTQGDHIDIKQTQTITPLKEWALRNNTKINKTRLEDHGLETSDQSKP